MMKLFALTIAALTASVSAQTLPSLPAQPSDCPATPDVDIENGVPIVPENVPEGCADFEVLVGKLTPPQSNKHN